MNTLATQLYQKFHNKKVLILGWAREGQSTYQTLRTVCPDAELTISDREPENIQKWEKETQQEVSSSPYLQNLSNFDVIFKTPGIPVQIPELQEFIAAGGVVTSQLNEFLGSYRDQIIGITGTKGKSTTASLIAHLFTAAGRDVVFAGNIGTPVFDVADEIRSNTTIVIEMSSYQLETVTTSPHVAVLLNLYAEHLNYHRTLELYMMAKAKITTFQKESDIVIYNKDASEIATVAEQSTAQKVPFSYVEQLSYPSSVETVLTELETVTLPSTIKQWNVLPALLAVQQLDLSPEQMIDALKSFRPLPHRLETVSNEREITWIDDTLATIPEATIAALDSLARVDVLLLGGYDRGISYQKIVDAIVQKNVPAIAFFKPSGQIMYDLLRQQYPKEKWPTMSIVETMEDAVRFAYAHAAQHGVVLLSPSSPSFGQFKDYRDKSAQFQHWIAKLANET